MSNYFPPHLLCLRYLSPKSPFSERGLPIDLKVSKTRYFRTAKVKFLFFESFKVLEDVIPDGLLSGFVEDFVAEAFVGF